MGISQIYWCSPLPDGHLFSYFLGSLVFEKGGVAQLSLEFSHEELDSISLHCKLEQPQSLTCHDPAVTSRDCMGSGGLETARILSIRGLKPWARPGLGGGSGWRNGAFSSLPRSWTMSHRNSSKSLGFACYPFLFSAMNRFLLIFTFLWTSEQ